MSCQVPLEPGDYNGRVDLGFSGRRGAAYPRSPKGGKGVTICQYRLSSERGRELWKGVMDRRKGRENGGEKNREVRGEEKARERNQGDAHSTC